MQINISIKQFLYKLSVLHLAFQFFSRTEAKAMATLILCYLAVLITGAASNGK